MCLTVTSLDILRHLYANKTHKNSTKWHSVLNVVHRVKAGTRIYFSVRTFKLESFPLKLILIT